MATPSTTMSCTVLSSQLLTSRPKAGAPVADVAVLTTASRSSRSTMLSAAVASKLVSKVLPEAVPARASQRQARVELLPGMGCQERGSHKPSVFQPSPAMWHTSKQLAVTQ